MLFLALRLKTVIPFGLVLVCVFVLLLLEQFPITDTFVNSLVYAVLVPVLVFVVPTCVLILLAGDEVLTLTPFIPSRPERRNWRAYHQRPSLNDEEFYAHFYSATQIPKDIAIRLRRVYAEHLRIDKVYPTDRAVDFLSELDFCELMQEVGSEFKIEISDQAIDGLDGTFQSIVEYLVHARGKGSVAAKEA